MEVSSRIDTIPNIEETPMNFDKETTTNILPISFCTSSIQGDLRGSSKGERFWVLGNEVLNFVYAHKILRVNLPNTPRRGIKL